MIDLTDSSPPTYHLYASPERFRSHLAALDDDDDDDGTVADAAASIFPHPLLASEAAGPGSVGSMASEDVAAWASSATEDDVSCSGRLRTSTNRLTAKFHGTSFRVNFPVAGR